MSQEHCYLLHIGAIGDHSFTAPTLHHSVHFSYFICFWGTQAVIYPSFGCKCPVTAIPSPLLVDAPFCYIYLYKCSKWTRKRSTFRGLHPQPYNSGLPHAKMNPTSYLAIWLSGLKTWSHTEHINNRSAPHCFQLLPFHHHCIITLSVFYCIIKVNEIL